MIKKNTSLMCGISLICLLGFMHAGVCDNPLVGESDYGGNKPLFDDAVFSFDVPLVSGKDGCSATITTDANNCTVITQNARVNGECQATGTPQTVCPGEQGDSCAVESVTQTANGRDIKFNCGGTTTTVPVANGTSCTMSLNKDATTGDVTVSKQCADESNPTTITIETADIATAAANKITADGTFATSGQLEALTARLPVMDTATGGITWNDQNGNSMSYGGYTFWIKNTFNKKISGKWFRCTTWTTNAPTTEWIMQHEILSLQCDSNEGWTYGTDCLLDGSIETYNVSPAKFKYNLCKMIKSGDITTLIDEQVADKGFAQQSTVTSLTERLETAESTITTKANSSDLAALQQTVADNLTEAKNYVDNKGFATEEYVTNAVATGVNTAGLCPGGTLESLPVSSGDDKVTYGVYCVVTKTED